MTAVRLNGHGANAGRGFFDRRAGRRLLAALTNRAALGYILVNALAALSAYSVIVAMGWDFGATGPEIPLAQLGVGSFGAMAFFRSSLFTVKVGTTDVAVGPAIFFQLMLAGGNLAEGEQAVSTAETSRAEVGDERAAE